MSQSETMCIHNKRVYTKHIGDVLTSSVIQVFRDIYADLQTNPSLANRGRGLGILELFQEKLSEVKSWNKERVSTEYKTVIERSKCNYFPDLLKAALIMYVKVELNGVKKLPDIKLVVPTPEHFYHKVCIECARELWKVPQLMYHGGRSIERQNALIACEEIFRKSIANTLRNSLPLEEIIKYTIQEAGKPSKHKVKEDKIISDNELDESSEEEDNKYTVEDDESESSEEEQEEQEEQNNEQESESSDEDENNEENDDDEESEEEQEESEEEGDDEENNEENDEDENNEEKQKKESEDEKPIKNELVEEIQEVIEDKPVIVEQVTKHETIEEPTIETEPVTVEQAIKHETIETKPETIEEPLIKKLIVESNQEPLVEQKEESNQTQKDSYIVEKLDTFF